MKLLSFGDVNVDFIAAVDSLPEGGEEVEMTEFDIHAGGSAANTAVAAQRLGLESVFMGRTGKGPLGHFLKKDFEDEGIDIGQVQEDADLSSGVMFVLITPGGERTMFSSRGANSRFNPREMDLECLDGVEYLHISGYAFIQPPQRDAGKRIIKAARGRDLKISLDPSVLGLQKSREEIESILSYPDFLFISEPELRMLTEISDIEEASEQLLEKGPSLIALKMGKKGCYVFTEKKRIFMKAFSTDVRGTTGAGDAFNAAFLVGLDRGWSLEKIAKFANAAGAISVSKFGARSGLPKFKEVESFLMSKENGTQ
ncbi:hypothetical protein AKJ54_00025 [candidate division MSBL1 archaeon SCGC-AAA382K21]|uniref:Carbohydrate kinase PfkB domain-containing protein n=1 Tax=candidate division MSBL1 archaeon SCGC-AAA382K21 TaxID=1698283 RepID=A0A133VMD7_9EURY|nr:hypothetical protein AKJ54_00025 [candidate division MSBL1 archaeon SCGC-AAA382K21]